MARADYAHWNEEADHMWWQEEGRHESYDAPEPFDPLDDLRYAYDYCPCEDGDDTVYYHVDGEYVYRECNECGCGTGTRILDATNPDVAPHVRKEAQEWLDRAGV